MNFRLAAISFAAHGVVRSRAPVAALLAVSAFFFSPAASALPSYDEVKQDFRSSETLILSREGEAIQRILVETVG